MSQLFLISGAVHALHVLFGMFKFKFLDFVTTTRNKSAFISHQNEIITIIKEIFSS
jgi:hypothetical protein